MRQRRGLTVDRIRERFSGRGAPDAAELANRVGEMAHPLEGPEDLGPLLERIGEARCVLLGEASHGTSEYYTWRARLSERLIREKGVLLYRGRGRLAGLLRGEPLREGVPGFRGGRP